MGVRLLRSPGHPEWFPVRGRDRPDIPRPGESGGRARWDTAGVTGRTAAPRAWANRHPRVADAVLALVVLAVSVPPLREPPGCGCPPTTAWAYVLVVAGCLPLVWRRRFPFGSALAVGGAAVGISLLGLPEPVLPFAALVAVHTVAAHARRRLALLGAALTAAALAVALAADPGTDADAVAVSYLVLATAWLLGDSARGRRERAAEAEERAVQLERTRDAEARRAVAEERNRIARDLHDHVAHHVSLMVVQAEAGPVALDRAPERAAEAFDSIGATGRQALGEMRQLLGLLRTGDADRLAPQPGLDRVEELVARVRRAGLPVELTVTGGRRALPPATDLSAYRIVQEALTNALRHAGPARATVTVAYAADELRLAVADDGVGCADRDARGGGDGLAGMRERAVLVGGRLDAGPRPAGGWSVSAVLPLPPA